MELNSVQPVSEGFFDVLDACCRQIVEKMGGKPIGEWRTADYSTLSSQLGQQTKVYLSENTLKRIFGRLKTPKRYYPQKATRDALAQFIGYRDWQEYEKIVQASVSKPAEATPVVIAATIPITEILPIEEKPRLKIWSIVVVVMSILVISTCLIYIFRENYVNPNDVSLVCENPVGEVPHTAVFKLSSKKPFDNTEQFTVDFMDEGIATQISGDKVVTQFFRNPGVVYVKLLYKGKVTDTATVYMQTKGWVANSANDTMNAYPIAGLRTLSEDQIFVSKKQLDSAGLNLAQPFLVGFSNIHSSSVSGENFEFNVDLEAEGSRPGVQCIESTIIILGEKSRHLITLYKPSCAAFSEYQLSEVKVDGSSKYLGDMGYDFKAGGHVRLRVKDKNVSLFIAGKKVMNTSYRNSIGRVMGIKVLFNGIGKVLHPRLFDLNTGELF